VGGRPIIEGAAPAAEALSYILEHTTPSEHERLLRGTVALSTEAKRIRHLLESWIVTIEMREHPDYARQFEAFVRLVESGELFEGTPLAGVRPDGIRAI